MLNCFFCHLTGNAFYCRNDGVLVIVEGTSCIGHVILMVTDVTDTRPVGINDEIVDVGNGGLMMLVLSGSANAGTTKTAARTRMAHRTIKRFFMMITLLFIEFSEDI